MVAAGMAHEDVSPSGSERSARQRWLYGGILAVVFISNSILSIAIKYLAMAPAAGGGTLMSAHSDAFMAVLYVSILSFLLVDQLVTRRPLMHPRCVVGLGLVCGMGSVGGVSLLARCAAFPAALVFTVCTIASLLFTSLVATFFLGEKRNLRWYIVVGLAIFAVLLAQGDALLQLVRK
jgi:drug/metabolite transporter (DMT)-like permease